MGFKYVYQKKWSRHGIGYILTAAANLLLFTFNDLDGSLQVTLLIIHLVLAGLGVIMGIHYLNIYQKDYIRFDEQTISIQRGPIIPGKKILLDEIDLVIEVSTVIELHLKNDKVQQFNSEWLDEKDLKEIKGRLEKLVT